MADMPRLQWVGKLEYLMASIGYMVGLGNLWRFPHQCFVNGGGAFFLPYLLAVVLCAVPVLFLEVFLGQFASQGAVNVWNFCPVFKGIGWAILFNVFVTNIYYAVIVMYSFYYMVVAFVSIGGPLPWQRCPSDAVWRTNKCSENPFLVSTSMSDSQKIDSIYKFMNPVCVNTSFGSMTYETFKTTFKHCLDFISPEEEYWNRFVLGVHESEGIDDLGAVVDRNAICLLIVWLFMFYCCHQGIRSIAKVVYITATFPVLLLLVLFVRGITLEGHTVGISFYTTADWSKLGDMAIWSSAATQAMYSVGGAFGGHIVLSSYSKFNNNIFRDSLILSIINSAISIFGGFIVFSFLGHASVTLERDIEDMVDSGPGLIFISYIQGISQLPGSSVWACLFFLTFFTLGLDSAIVMMWTMYSSIADVFPAFFYKWGKVALGAMCAIQYLLSLPLVSKGGIHMVVLIDHYIAAFSLPVFVFVETVSVCWIYGLKNFVKDIEMMIGKKGLLLQWFLRITWLVTAPIFSVFIFLASAISYSKPSYGGQPVSTGGEVMGWLIIITPIVIIITFGCYQVLKQGRPTMENIRNLIKKASSPYSSWGPLLEENRTGRYTTCAYITPCADIELTRTNNQPDFVRQDSTTSNTPSITRQHSTESSNIQMSYPNQNLNQELTPTACISSKDLTKIDNIGFEPADQRNFI